MRVITYILANGTKTTNYTRAEQNKPYRTVIEKIAEKPCEISDKRKAMRIKI